MKVPLTFKRLDVAPQGEQVFKPETTQALIEMLETVVTDGTGRRAKVPGYRVAGKTGTVLVAGMGGYQAHRYNASFVGMAPASHPRLVVAVVVQDLSGKFHSGTSVAAPAWEKIMEGALRIMNVAPDQA